MIKPTISGRASARISGRRGPPEPDLIAESTVNGVWKHGVRFGNWLTLEQSNAWLHAFNDVTLRRKRDYA